MRTDILKSVKGGYTKVSVLTKIDAYNAILMMAEEGQIDRSVLLSQFESARAYKLENEKGGFFGKYGFDTEAADAYLADLENKILSALK